jgi:hypothetical protein
MQVPRPRGALSEAVAVLFGGGDPDPLSFEADLRRIEDVLTDEDLQLALWMLYELHYRGFADIDDYEWDPRTLRLRALLESRFEEELRRRTEGLVRDALASSPDVVDQIVFMIDHADGPDLASFLQRRATRTQLVDFLVNRSLYHLKESDPHSFVLPRIDGRAKVALAELQFDEYAAGLDDRYGAYVDEVPGHTLASNNLSSMFGLHRRLRGAALGHLAAFESTSSVPCRKIAAGVERLGFPAATAAYFHEHVEADATHEQVALRDICGTLVEDEPQLREDVLFGAAACLHLDALVATQTLGESEAVAS